MRVPRLDPLIADAPQAGEIRAGIDRVLTSGRFIGGPEVDELESELAAHLTVPSVVCCASGTDALTLGLMGIARLYGSDSSGSLVVVPALSFSATASAVVRAGMRPVFVDVDPDTLLLDWEAAAAVPDAHAVVPVHLYGRVCAPPSGWAGPPILEDACQAFDAATHGIWAGHVGTAAAFSFFPSKPLGCYGDGGALACSLVVADLVRPLARHGATKRYVSKFAGFNSRLDAIQAAILRAKLAAVEWHRLRRAEVAGAYHDQLSDQQRLRLPEWVLGHAWHCYVVRVVDGSRDGLLAHLRDRGVDAVVQYPVPLHQMPAFRDVEPLSLPNAELACTQVLGLPIWSGMTKNQVDRVVDAVRSF